MRPANAFTTVAGAFVVIVLWKNGTLLKLVQQAGTGAQTVITGLKPVISVG